MKPEEDHEGEDWENISDEEWEDICAVGRIDPVKREKSRTAIINREDAMDCTIFRLRTDEKLDDCIELCDAKIVLIGKHQVPEGLDEEEFEDLYGGLDVDRLVDALVEYVPNFEDIKIEPEPSDFVSVEPGAGISISYQLIDFFETEDGRRCILLNCIDECANMH